MSGTTEGLVVSGNETSEVLNGQAGNDLISGLGGNDTLDGGAGDDYLDGGEGNDVFIFGLGSGNDVINSYDGTVGKLDTVRLGSTITTSNLIVSRDGDALVLTISGASDSLRIESYFANDGASGYQVEQLKFTDGSNAIWTFNTVKSKLGGPTSGNDTLFGYDAADSLAGLGGNDYIESRGGADTLDGGAGSDTLYGGDGVDTYIFNAGSGQDVIYCQETGESADIIQLGAGILAANVAVSQEGSDLLLAISGSTDGLRLANYFLENQAITAQADLIKFADATVWDSAEVKKHFNTAPTSADGAFTVGEDGTYSLALADFSFNDQDAGDSLQSVTITSLPTAGTLTLDGAAVTAGQSVSAAAISAGKLVYAPAANGNGEGYGSFGFKVSDGITQSAAQTMTAHVTPVNDAPAGADGTITVERNEALSLTLANFGFTDPDSGDGLQAVTIVSLPGAGSLTLDGLPVGADQTITAGEIGEGRLVFTPEADTVADAYASFTFKVSDGLLTSAASYTLTVDVVPTNQLPSSDRQTITINEDQARPLALADFPFTDPDSGNSLQALGITSLPAAGSLSLNGAPVAVDQVIAASDITAGRLVYTPAANASGDDYAYFGFRVSDGKDMSAEEYVFAIDVAPVNDVPTAANQTFTLAEDSSRVLAVADFGFADIDNGDSLQGVTITTVPTAGSLKLNGVAVSADQVVSAADINGGKLVYTPAANANGNGYGNFGFKVGDGAGTSDASYTMTFNVTPVADAPTAANRALTLAEDSSRPFTVADFGFVDVDSGDTLHEVTISTLPLKGSLKFNGIAVAKDQVISAADIGKLVYTPAANGYGSNYASFKFSVSDGGLSSASYTMTLNVTGVRDDLAIDGTLGNDTLAGDRIDVGSYDRLTGLAGNDYLQGKAGNDRLLGGDGSDTLDGGTGADTLEGGAGNDLFYVDNAGDRVSDNLSSLGGTDTVISSVSFSLKATAATSYVENLRLNSAADINGTGNALSNTIYAGAGINVIDGSTGIDTLSYAYATTASGSAGITLNLGLVSTTTSLATASGISKADKVKGIENLEGSKYNDRFTGTSAANLLDGALGADTLAGGGGNDTLMGGAGADSLSGGDGVDILNGGAGKDYLNGGNGYDYFVFNTATDTGTTSATWDVISGFARGQDKIDLSAMDANSALAGNQNFTGLIGATAAFTAAGQLKLVNGVLYGNTDGDATAEFAIQLTGITALSNSDIIL